MTHDEFFAGWCLLVIQPWGQKYNRTNPDGSPEATSKLQLEFYFDKLKHGTAMAWMRTAEQYAVGKEWPSVTDLRTTMRHKEAQPKQLTYDADRELVPMPENVKTMVLKYFGEPRRLFGPYIDDSVPEPPKIQNRRKVQS